MKVKQSIAKILTVILLVSTTTAVCETPYTNNIYAPLRVYLDSMGVTNSAQLLRPSQGKIHYVNIIDEEPKILKWDVPNIPEPSISQLLPPQTAKRILQIPIKYRKAVSYYPYFIEMTDDEKAVADLREIINQQKIKTAELRKAETEVFKLLKTSLNVSTNEYRITKLNLVKYISNITITNVETLLKFAEIQKNIQLIGIINTGEVADIYDHEYLNNIKL